MNIEGYLENDTDYYGYEFGDEIRHELDAEQKALKRQAEELALEKEKVKTPEEIRRKHRIKESAEAALLRIEVSSRTVEDYNRVIKEWDHLDENKRRRDNYHEVLRGNVPLDYGCSNVYEALIFPRSINTPSEQQIARGYLFDFLADCPFEMHDLTSSKYIRDIVMSLKDEQKELLYFLGVKKFKVPRYAAMRGQSDRNIRRARSVVYGKIRRRMYAALLGMMNNGYAPTFRERCFIQRYEAGMEEEDDE